MEYWLFIINNEVSVFKKRIESKEWPIYDKTSFRKNLRAGDYILFYKAGVNDAQKFVGKARIAAQPKAVTDTLVYNLKIKDVSVWEKCPSIRDYLTKLSFIKDERNWGIYLQGGVKRLTKQEYSMLTRKAERMNEKN